ncbi:MAG: NAD-dependent succinate-semialdehyde dehydrogenase [Leptolyngbyaceae cyanobacterium MO_188.B28]|nr:NAD-dependent succinate-semialdehyde dehydrogenase [Leptolyngbyaceae cyanobacterium MO_188.B28]
MGIASINPATGEKIKVFEALTDTAVAAKLNLAQAGFERFRHTSFSERAGWFKAAAQILEDKQEDFGRLMTLEMGKTLASAIAEAKKCAWVCRYYAEHAAEFLTDTFAETDASQSFIRYQPLGVLLAVMPWNFPFWQVFRFAAPSLMAGNVALLKHASNVPQCALAIEEIFQQAGFPEGVFQTLLIGADKVAGLMADDRIKAATLTGSEAAGSSLAAAAGKQIKKVVLELGGSDPFIVLESADLDAAVATAVTARMLNNGQSCIAAKRFILADAIADDFQNRLKEKFQALKLGDPMEASTDIGPLATPDILHDIDQQVRACLDKGAIAMVGGKADPTQLPANLRQGNFYPPTLLTDIPPGTPADNEEFFGPVALAFRVSNLDAAIKLANATPLGLGASAWTADPAESDRLINEIEAGAVFINGMVKSDPRIPFGGVKRSGYGRELGIQGIHEFVNLKTVWIK